MPRLMVANWICWRRSRMRSRITVDRCGVRCRKGTSRSCARRKATSRSILFAVLEPIVDGFQAVADEGRLAWRDDDVSAFGVGDPDFGDPQDHGDRARSLGGGGGS